MKILVQKFGGTSVAKPESRMAVVGKVKEAQANGFAPVLVVSAMGRKGDPYATDTLIGVLKTANPMVNAREMDTMMCCGEIISAAVMTATLQAEAINAVALTGGQAGIVTDSQFGMAKIKNIDTEELLRLVSENIVPVVCGFQGVTANNGKFTTLGRGGSDTTAAALGAALGADAVEIYTDVDGIMTADPRIVENATILQSISYEEVCQMAHQGAKVIHPRAVEIAMRSNIPLIVKSTFSNAPGTRIHSSMMSQVGGEIPISERIASGVAHLMDISQFKIKLDASNLAAGEKVFDALAAKGVSVDCLNLQPELAMFTVNKDDLAAAEAVVKATGYVYELNRDCAKVSVVGAGMNGVPGVMAKFVSSMTGKNISILQTVDSHTTISAIIHADCVKEAVNALHEAFKL